jgi:hypothetical protein
MNGRLIVLFWLLLTCMASCRKETSMDPVGRVVESEMRKRHLKYTGPDADGTYETSIDGYIVRISVQNIARDYARDKDTAAIRRFAENALAGFGRPTWERVRDFIRFSLEPSDHDFGETIHDTVSKTISRVLVYTDAADSRISWITPDMLASWGTTKELAQKIALENMSRLIDTLSPQIDTVAGVSLGAVPLSSEAFKASIITAPNFKQFATKKLRWPVLVVIPCRDFVYLLSEADSAILNKMGKVVQDEYRKSGYPLTTEVFRISDDGIKAIGEFPK